MRLSLALFIITVLFIVLLIGTSLEGKNNDNRGSINQEYNNGNGLRIVSSEQKPHVFFYYIPGCPSCETVKPYLFLMKDEVREVEFEFCNVLNHSSSSSTVPSNCSKESLILLEENSISVIPVVILVNGNEKTILTGWKEVGTLGKELKKLGIDTPNVVYNQQNYNIDDCLSCHEDRNLQPPSTYSCTYCCHSS